MFGSTQSVRLLDSQHALTQFKKSRKSNHCHTSEIYACKSFPCHTYKNKGLKVLCLPHIFYFLFLRSISELWPPFRHLFPALQFSRAPQSATRPYSDSSRRTTGRRRYPTLLRRQASLPSWPLARRHRPSRRSQHLLSSVHHLHSPQHRPQLDLLARKPLSPLSRSLTPRRVPVLTPPPNYEKLFVPRQRFRRVQGWYLQTLSD